MGSVDPKLDKTREVMPILLSTIDYAALTLYTIYLGGVLGGIWAMRKTSGKQRFWGLALSIESAGAALLLTLMSTKYWSNGAEELIGLALAQLVSAVTQVSGPFLIGVAMITGIAYLTIVLARKNQRITSIILPCLVIPIIFAASTPPLIAITERNKPVVREATTQSEMEVSHGFHISVYKKGEPLQNPTSITLGPDNNLYVANFNGDVWGISTEDGSTWKYATGFHIPVGLAWHDNSLYVASEGKVSIVHDINGDHVGDTVEDIITDLPAGIYHFHANNGLVFGADDRLYFGVGSTSDSSVENYQYAASVLSAKADGSDLRVFAVGVRNPYRLAFNSKGDLFATDNGPNELAEAPGDELNLIVEGGDYGFPTEFGIASPGSATQSPVALFPPHASADGLVFYHDDQFPQEYYDNAFVTLLHHGQIYRVQFNQDANGNYTTRLSLFVTGLSAPLDIVVGPDGSLYVLDFTTSAIYKIEHVGVD